jgi:hypothetical protein
MNPAQHVTNTGALGRPVGTTHDEVVGLPITRITYEGGMQAVRSFWRPTPEEIAAISAGALVSLDIWGNTHAPVLLAVDGVTTP